MDVKEKRAIQWHARINIYFLFTHLLRFGGSRVGSAGLDSELWVGPKKELQEGNPTV